MKLYRVARQRDDGSWHPVDGLFPGRKARIYVEERTAKSAVGWFRNHESRSGPFRIETIEGEWQPVE